MKAKWILWPVGVTVLVMTIIFALLRNIVLCAQFNIDALHRYLEAAFVIEGKTITGLQDLPEVHLISHSQGFRLHLPDLQDGFHYGYAYHFRVSEQGLVISASPQFRFPPQVEFGVTPDGNLRMNTKGVDSQADSEEEMRSWPVILRNEDIRTELPVGR